MRSRTHLLSIMLLGIVTLGSAQTPTNATDAKDAAAAVSKTSSCVMRCEKSSASCSSQVRRARQICSKKAANAGRDPMLMRRDYSTYFCGYFDSAHCARNPSSKDCRSRFSRRHGLCVDVIQDNIAAQRYDCYLNERDAQNFCRDELRDCKEICGT